MKRFLVAISISLLMFVSAYFTMRAITRPSGIVVEKWRVLESGFDKKLKELPCFFSFKLKSPSYLFVTTDIPKTRDVRYLYFPQIDVSYLEVYANGNLIGSFGSKYTKTGRIWYQPLIYELPVGTDRISLKMYGTFMIALGTHAVILGERNLWRYELLSFLTLKLHLIGIGMVASLGLIMLMISMKVGTVQRKIYVLIGLASLAASTWLLVQTPFWSMGSYSQMLVTRKILISMLYISAAFLVAGISQIFGYDKFGKFLICSNVVVSVVLWSSPSAYYLKVAGDYSAFLAILSTFYLFLKSAKLGSVTVTSLLGFSVIVSIHDTVFIMTSRHQIKPLSIYGVISALLGFAYLIVIEYERLVLRYRESELEKITDHLTGAFNRKVLRELNVGAFDTLVFVDLNDFKKINDELGHDVGDEVLKKFVEIAKENLRSEDVVIRLGGDEFLIVMRRCSKNEARDRIEKIREIFKGSHRVKPTFSYGITRFSGNLNESVKLADEKMYEMKRTSKSNK